MLSENLKVLLEQTESVERTKARIEVLDIPALERDPVFLADVMKGQLVEDILATMETQCINKNQLAELLGMSRQYVGRILNETANFTIDSIAKIAAALNHSVQVKLYGHDEVLDVIKVRDHRMAMRNFTVMKSPIKSSDDEYRNLAFTKSGGDYDGCKELKFVS